MIHIYINSTDQWFCDYFSLFLFVCSFLVFSLQRTQNPTLASLLCFASISTLIISITARRINTNEECNHYYNYPIDIRFSVNSSRTKGLQSMKYSCNLNTTTWYNVRFNNFYDISSTFTLLYN